MADFRKLGADLSGARVGREASRLELHRARERLEQVETARAELERHFDPENQEHVVRRRQLAGEVEQAAARLDETRRGFDSRTARALELAGAFDLFSDPRDNLGQMAAAAPILLFPVRIETRFKEVTSDNRTRHQLWVRVFPDDCLVDTFEETLSESELRSVRRFWINWARAGGVLDQQKAAWRALAGTSGSGRAAWLVRQYRPDNEAQLPGKSDPTEIFLVVATEAPVPESEQGHVADYWLEVWRAPRDAAAQTAAAETLASRLGDARAAEVLADHEPANLEDPPPAGVERADASVRVVFLDLPSSEGFETQRVSWSQPPRVHLLPERFVLLGYRGEDNVLDELGAPIPLPLMVGPDPLAEPKEQIRQEGGEIAVGDELAWMLDFDEAVRVGMGFRIDLSDDDVELGFDQLMVLGVRLSADETAGKELVEELFLHHQQGTAGFGLLPTGTPTNNTEGKGSGFSETEAADDSFDLAFGDPTPLARSADYLTRLDGQWLADTLGIDLGTFERTAHSRGRDMCEARAMNIALWPATWGYLMESMMAPVFDQATIARTRWFFTRFVTGRGLAPAIRIGQQPYGILPTTLFGRSDWLEDDGWQPPRGVGHPEGFRGFLRQLHGVFGVMREDWQGMTDRVAFVGKEGDPHQILLDVVGLSPSSVEYHQRWAESIEEIGNRLNLAGLGGAFVLALIALGYTQSGMILLNRLGYTEGEVPEILEKFFLDDPNLLSGDIIDDRELSESEPIRVYTPDGRNYIEWLVKAAGESFERLRKEEGFLDDRPPTALLYLLLRYALEQGYWDAGLRVLEEHELLSAAELATARIDPSFVHVADRQAAGAAVGAVAERQDRVVSNKPAERQDRVVSNKPIHFDRRSESRYEFLYRTAPEVTGSDSMLVAEFLPGLLGKAFGTRYLSEQLRALGHLENTPTARLERALAEHLDLCSYRLDAWRWGLLHYQLAVIREGGSTGHDDGGARPGVFVGAFGWLEDVRSEHKELTPVDLEEEGAPELGGDGLPTPMRDSTNAGFIHAPSLNHGIAAAILRNGYLSNSTPSSPDTLAVNLSSARVRTALGIIEGIRSGQPLGALLGYRLERELHDRHALAEVDAFIFALRRAFPLVADHLADTEADPGEPIEAVEARNVVDGLALVEHLRDSGEDAYPFGKPLPTATGPQAAILTEAAKNLVEAHDALADLAVSEAVYQAVLGNYERTGATLDAYSQGTFPPEPEVVQTPRSGLSLTHRVGLHLEAGLDPTVSPNALAVTPRVLAEPAVNRWLDGVLPDPAEVVCIVDYTDPADDSAHTVEVSQQDLGLQPLDLLYLVDPEVEQAMAELDDRVTRHVVASETPRLDVELAIRYNHRTPGRFSFFEVGALLRSLRRLVLRSRALNATDLALFNEARKAEEQQVAVDPQRVQVPLAGLAELVAGGAADDLTKLVADMDALLGDTTANREPIIDAVEGWSDRFVPLALAAGEFGIPQAAFGFVFERRRTIYRALLASLEELLTRWQKRLDDYATKVAAVPGLPTPEEQFEALRQAERLVTTAFTTPQPPSPGAYTAILDGKRDDLGVKRIAFDAIHQAPPATVAGLLRAIEGELPIDAFDTAPLELDDQRAAQVRFAEDLRALAGALAQEVVRRRDAAQALVGESAAATDSRTRVDLLVKAGQAVFGEDFRLVPEFSVAGDQADELANAWSERGELLRYLTDPEPAGLAVEFPVDDWLYGVARVREKMELLEHVTLTANAFETSEPVLTPIQLPYRAGDRWLALGFPAETDLEGDRLAYAAHFSVPFDKSAPQCGLLVDEWTEVIPAREETTGIAFHYDRPNSEPPQALLLATAPTFEGGWSWDDLVQMVRETFAEARLRAVEPAQVDDGSYARFLPAAISSVTRFPISIGLNLAANLNIVATLAEDGDA